METSIEENEKKGKEEQEQEQYFKNGTGVEVGGSGRDRL